MMLQENKTMLIIMLICLVGVSAIAIYKMVTKGEPPFINFAIVAALSSAILKQLPLFIKYKYLNAIPVVAAVVLLLLGIFSEIKH